MSIGPEVMGLAIYNSKSGLNYYHKYTKKMDFDTDRVTNLFCLLRGIERLDERLMIEKIGEIKCHPFSAKFKDDVLKVIDNTGVLNNIHFHDFNGLSGLFSVSNNTNESFTKKLFKDLVKIIKTEDFHPNIRPSKEKINKINKKLETYCNPKVIIETKGLIRTYV
ncbi:hypothetical protein GF352_04055 [archaeon]|nr:hypothetical protein [archaeon]